MSDLDSELDKLPAIDKAPCRDCGAADWESCNLDRETNEFYECNVCCEWDEKQQKLVRKNAQ